MPAGRSFTASEMDRLLSNQHLSEAQARVLRNLRSSGFGMPPTTWDLRKIPGSRVYFKNEKARDMPLDERPYSWSFRASNTKYLDKWLLPNGEYIPIREMTEEQLRIYRRRLKNGESCGRQKNKIISIERQLVRVLRAKRGEQNV